MASHDSRWRRWTRRSVLAAAMVGVASVAGWATMSTVASRRYADPDRLPEGALSLGDGVAGRVAIGDHRVDLRGRSLRITDASGRVLWARSGRRSFLGAARGRLSWEDTTGHFSAERTLRVLYTEQSVERVEVDGATVMLAGSVGAAEDPQDAVGYVLRLRSARPDRLEVEVETAGTDLVFLYFDRENGESVHGLGEQFTDFDLTGSRFPLLTREQGIGRGREPLTTLAELTNGAGGSAETTYAPMPVMLTDRSRALVADTHRPAAVDLRGADEFTVEVWQDRTRVGLHSAGTPAALVASHTRDTGRQSPLPDWSGRGAIAGLQGGTEVVRGKLDALESAGAQLAGVWLQDWTGQRRTDFGDRLWWHWELDENHYPGWNDLIADLRRRDLRVLTYVNPFLCDPSARPSGVRRDLFAEARRLEYLVRTPTGSVYLLDQGGFDAALVDLSNPRAWAWFHDVIVEQVAGAGAEGWMADFGEGLPMDAALHRSTAQQWHNRWPVEWARLNREAARSAGKPEALVFHRSAALGSAEHAGLFWAGDQLVDFGAHDGLGSAVRGMLAGGVSGMAFNHSDAGGYTGLGQPVVGVSRSRELLLRWVELNVWGPVLRTHEGNQPWRNAQVYDPDCRGFFAEQTRVFAALANYRREVVAEASRTGIPVLRHAWLHEPASRAARIDTSFFFGPAFFIAPVLQRGEDQVGAVLPPGEWVHLWSGRTFPGDSEAVVSAPLGRPGVFYRKNDPVGENVRARLPELLD